MAEMSKRGLLSGKASLLCLFFLPFSMGINYLRDVNSSSSGKDFPFGVNPYAQILSAMSGTHVGLVVQGSKFEVRKKLFSVEKGLESMEVPEL